MKAARSLVIVSALLLLALVTAALAAYAGTADDPEVGDTSGDSTTGRDSHDIIAAWVDAEDNGTVTLVLQMTALDAISPRDDWLSLPTSIYEYYFSIGKVDYALRATVPVHGPFAALANFNLYTVDYGETGNMTYSDVGGISGQYLINDGDLSLSVDKADIGSPSKGDLMEHMWAAIYFQPRGGTREEVDVALSYDHPGRTYTFRGQYTQLYDVKLQAENVTVQSPNNAVATFNITIKSQSTTDLMVNMTNRTLPAGYFVNWSRNMPVPVPEGDSASLFLLVTVPENATNGTNINVIIKGVYDTEEGAELETDELNLLLQVRYVPPKKPKEDKTIPQMILDFVKGYPWVIALVAVAAVFAVLYYLWAAKKKREEDALLDQYKAYVESQGEQRETGEVY
jgi:hypothetical protein